MGLKKMDCPVCMSEQQRAQAAKPKDFHGTKPEAGRTTEPFPYQCKEIKEWQNTKAPVVC